MQLKLLILLGLAVCVVPDIADAYDVTEAVVDWITGSSTVDFDPGSPKDFSSKAVQEWLKDGIVLCRLMNVVQPGTIKRINTNVMFKFMAMENIGFFTEAMRSYGVQPDYLFTSVDLYEAKNMEQVMIGLRAFANKATQKGHKPAISI